MTFGYPITSCFGGYPLCSPYQLLGLYNIKSRILQFEKYQNYAFVIKI